MEVALHPPRAHRGEQYWAKPLAGFGDPQAWLVVVGLAPAAQGGNRTGRIFTGDRSGDWLFRALWRAGFANQPTSVSRDDGLELKEAWVTAAVRCAPPGNRPSVEERDTCKPWLARELELLERARVVIALGAFAHHVLVGLFGLRPKPAFRHLREAQLKPGMVLLDSYHPSQRNTFTGLLSADDFDRVFARARELGPS